jgi:hypothetical protein
MKCKCEGTGVALHRVCDLHKAFVDAATQEASYQAWTAAIRIHDEVAVELGDLIQDKFKASALLGAKLYMEALQKRFKFIDTLIRGAGDTSRFRS